MRPRKSQIITTFIPDVPTEKQTAAWRLFHIKYACQVAQIHTETLEYLESRPVEGNEYQGQGRLRAQQMVMVMLPVSAMADMLAEGATVVLKEPADAMRIYNDVKQHLTDWQQYQQISIHGRMVPEEDLRRFDVFATYIYPHARHDIVTSGSDLLFGNSSIGQLIRGGSGLSGFSRFSREQREVIDLQARGTDETPLQHNSMVAAILEPKIRKSKWTRED